MRVAFGNALFDCEPGIKPSRLAPNRHGRITAPQRAERERGHPQRIGQIERPRRRLRAVKRDRFGAALQRCVKISGFAREVRYVPQPMRCQPGFACTLRHVHAFAIGGHSGNSLLLGPQGARLRQYCFNLRTHRAPLLRFLSDNCGTMAHLPPLVRAPSSWAMACGPALIDQHGRTISYLRISVTDRCDLRCRYCMAEEMTFLPRDQLLSLEEIALIAERFIARGVSKIRLSGGEPLVRRDVVELARRLGRSIGRGLDELTMTTNATRLAQHADGLYAAGMRRINVSLDSRDPATFRHITRHGDVHEVVKGIFAARDAGLHVKINLVALKGLNDQEIPDMLAWCGANGFDLSLIETMPLGAIDEDRADRFVPLTAVFADLERRFALSPSAYRSGGPARYWRVSPWGNRLGLISPLTNNFCATCNRVRLTTEGKLYMCLGHDDHVDLKAAIRSGGLAALDDALDRAMGQKPERHAFAITSCSAPSVARHMSVTGG